MVSILYCFMTSEVRIEVKKMVNKWKWKRGLPSIVNRKMSHSQNPTQMTTFNSKLIINILC